MAADANTALTYHDMWLDQKGVGGDVAIFFSNGCMHMQKRAFLSHRNAKRKMFWHETKVKVCWTFYMMFWKDAILLNYVFVCVCVCVSCYASQVKCCLFSVILSRSINPLKTFAILLSICDFRTNCLLKHRCGRQTKSPPLKTNLKQEIALLTLLPRKQRKRPPLSGMTRWHEHKRWSRWLFWLIIG